MENTGVESYDGVTPNLKVFLKPPLFISLSGYSSRSQVQNFHTRVRSYQVNEIDRFRGVTFGLLEDV